MLRYLLFAQIHASIDVVLFNWIMTSVNISITQFANISKLYRYVSSFGLAHVRMSSSVGVIQRSTVSKHPSSSTSILSVWWQMWKIYICVCHMIITSRLCSGCCFKSILTHAAPAGLWITSSLNYLLNNNIPNIFFSSSPNCIDCLTWVIVVSTALQSVHYFVL